MKKDAEHIALYRKYRPTNFDEVIGQDHVVSVLRKSILNKVPAHAYLLTGSRGIGKTTIARIIAHELGTSVNDIYEIDAASNRGIDDIRSLREGVRTLPFDSQYKVYIIDEVHMLTKEAWNALLKTLEEPPVHVIFILATTELDRVPDTVQSRCQTYVFKKPTEAVLSEIVQNVAKKEGYTIDDVSADLVALLGDGSFRDTLGVLEKVITNTQGKKITITDVEAITGAPRGTLVNDCLEGILKGDADSAITAVHKASAQNVSIDLFTRLLIEKFRVALLVRYAPKDAEQCLEKYSSSDQVFLRNMGQEKSERLTSASLVRFLDALLAKGYTAIPTLPLELAILDILK